jgi:GT2 family glycosyltransferase
MTREPPRLSLVLATVDRTVPLERFLRSLDAQTYRNVDLVIVDQNEDDRVERVLRAASPAVPVVRVRSARGLSRARNAALTAVSGDIVAFPDDDCWYEATLLERVVERFARHPEWDGICARPGDEQGALTHSRWHTRPGRLTRFNVWHRAMSPTIFLRRRVVERVGGFDERLGPGAESGLYASDETEFLLRAIALGFRLEYDPSLIVFHPDPSIEESPAARPYAYGRSMGAVLRAHRFPAWYVAYACLRPLGGAVLAFARRSPRRASFHVHAFRGRVAGAVRRPLGRERRAAGAP